MKNPDNPESEQNIEPQIVPMIIRDVGFYRMLARNPKTDEDTLRAALLVAADDLEEALDAACPLDSDPAAQ